MNTAFYADKTVPRHASSTASSGSKSAGLKTLRNRRFACCFSLLVHSIENLPATFDNVSLVVHWNRPDSNQMTCPVRVLNGVAKFEEQLSYSCPVYGSKIGAHHSAKYEALHFWLYASVYGSSELDLGKHRVDLTRLLPLTLEELVEEKSSGKWSTKFRLSGRASGGIMNASFGYVVIDKHSSNSSIAPFWNTNVPEMLSTQPNRSRTAKLADPSVLKDDPSTRGRLLNMEDDSDLVTSDFLEMLGIEKSPSLSSSESEPDSPRERLLREFEKDALAIFEDSCKITEVHVSGWNTDKGKKKLRASKNQPQAGSRWLLSNGMGKENKHPLKAAVKPSDPAFVPMTTTTAQPGDTLWSISSRFLGRFWRR